LLTIHCEISQGAYTMVAAGTFNGFPIPKVVYFANEIAA